MLRALVLLVVAAAALAACSGPPCRSKDDCPIGYYCVIELGDPGEIGEGECRFDCESHEDCPQPDRNLSMAICSNEGKCRTIPLPPKLRLLEPETDTVYPEGTRAIRISGEVETAADRVNITVEAAAQSGCFGAGLRAVTVENPNPGTMATLPFVLDDVALDPGRSVVLVDAAIGGSKKKASVDVKVDCEGCAKIIITDPMRRASVPGLELGALRGTIEPASVSVATWRVFSYENHVIDGPMGVNGGNFFVDRLPLFPGINRVEVVVTGVGSGLGESRCSALVSAGITTERGLRALLSWDGASSDLDLHVIGPGGRFGDAASSLSSRGRHPFFGGTLDDDSEGFGPEIAQVPQPADGVYGIIVEPVVDGGDFGSDAFVRLLFDGRPIFTGPVGPQHLTALEGKLWVVGKVDILNGSVAWEKIDRIVSATNPPVTDPAMWPVFQ